MADVSANISGLDVVDADTPAVGTHWKVAAGLAVTRACTSAPLQMAVSELYNVNVS